MNKTIKSMAILILLLKSVLLAEFAPPPGYGNDGEKSKEDGSMSIYYPHDSSPESKNMPEQLKKNKFHLNIDQDDVEDVHAKRIRFKQLIDGTYDVGKKQAVSYRPLKAIDTIHLLVNYTSTISFPSEYSIVKSIASIELKEIRSSGNILFLQPKKDFSEGNVVVSLSDGKRNYIVNLVLEKFVKRTSGTNVPAELFVSYVDVPKISNYELLKMYFKMYGNKRASYFSQDNAYDVIMYKEVPFYLIRDDRFGTIEYLGVNFRIQNSL